MTELRKLSFYMPFMIIAIAGPIVDVDGSDFGSDAAVYGFDPVGQPSLIQRLLLGEKLLHRLTGLL